MSLDETRKPVIFPKRLELDTSYGTVMRLEPGITYSKTPAFWPPGAHGTCITEGGMARLLTEHHEGREGNERKSAAPEAHNKKRIRPGLRSAV
jgi:hypothetical protein